MIARVRVALQGAEMLHGIGLRHVHLCRNFVWTATIGILVTYKLCSSYVISRLASMDLDE